jgi:hypothetical protein
VLEIYECWSDDICEYECFHAGTAAEKYAEWKFQKDNDVGYVRGLDVFVKGSHGTKKFSIDVQMEPYFYATEVYD